MKGRMMTVTEEVAERRAQGIISDIMFTEKKRDDGIYAFCA
jgi:hypothetical protein